MQWYTCPCQPLYSHFTWTVIPSGWYSAFRHREKTVTKVWKGNRTQMVSHDSSEEEPVRKIVWSGWSGFTCWHGCVCVILLTVVPETVLKSSYFFLYYNTAAIFISDISVKIDNQRRRRRSRVSPIAKLYLIGRDICQSFMVSIPYCELVVGLSNFFSFSANCTLNVRPHTVTFHYLGGRIEWEKRVWMVTTDGGDVDDQAPPPVEEEEDRHR